MMIWEDLYIYFFSPRFQYMMFLNLFSSLWARNTCTHSWRILESSWHVAVAEFSLFFSRLCSLIRGYLHDTFLLKMSRNKPEWGSFVKTEACVARRHGALSIQRKFRFEISEISGAQWTCTFRLDRPDPSHRAFGYCSCKQDTKERYWGQQFCQMERDISVRPTEMTRPVTVDHLQSWSRIFRSDQTEMVRSIWCTNRNFRNFGLNGKRSWTEAPSTSIRFCLTTDFFSPIWSTAHTYPVKTVTENGSFKNAPQSEDFRKRRLFVYVWKDEDGGFRILWRRAKTIPKDA